MLSKLTKFRHNGHGRMIVTAMATILIVAAIGLSNLGFPLRPAQAAGTPVVFRVDANGQITANGSPIRVKGASWFGLQGRYEIATDSVNPRGAPMEQYMGNVFWAPSGRTYDQDISEIKAMGINVIRLPVVTQTLKSNPCDPQGLDPVLKNDPSVRIQCARTALETILKKLDAAGIYVLLDIHSCSNYVDWRKGRLDARPPYVDATRDNYDFKREDSSCAANNNPSTVTRIQAYNETLWLQDLQILAGLESSLGISNVIGIDIFNEPWDYTWADWKTLTEHAYNTINAVNPNILIFMQGTSNTANNQDGIVGNEVTQNIGNTTIVPNWGENLADAGANPPAIPKDRLVFSPHAYGPSVFVGKQFMDPAQSQCTGLEADAAGDAKCNIVINPALLENGWQASFGYLKALGYAVVVGEWGGNIDWPGGAASTRDKNRWGYLTDKTTDLQWQQAFVNYLLKVGIYDTIYWSLNPESGDTGGLYTTPYIAGTNETAWGTWGALNSTKMTLVHKLWDVPPVIGPTPTFTFTPTGPTPTRTNTFTPSNTPTKTATSTMTLTPAPGLHIQVVTGGTDNTQQSQFHVRLQNTGTTSLSNVSFRVYFTPDGSNAASGYTLEKYYDQSNAASVSGPTLASGSTYYFTVSFGTASLAAANSWEFDTALHLSNWGTTYSGTNDWWHTAASLPASFTDWPTIPGYLNGTRAWGSEPGPTVTGTPTYTPTNTATFTATRTATRTFTPTNTATGPTRTFTSTSTRTRTPTPSPTGSLPCSPVTSTISAPYTFDGAGTFCWQATNLGSFINSWNLATLKINGVDITNKYISASSYPPKINGFWYVYYVGNYAWSHIEAK